MLTVDLSKAAIDDLDDIHRQLFGFSEIFANRCLVELDVAIRQLSDPFPVWSYFHITGAPYRAKLFSIGRRTAFWIVFRIHDEEDRVKIHRIWSTLRNPKSFAP